MQRSYEIEPHNGGWKLKLYEDGEEAGGGIGDAEDYNELLSAGEEFCGIDTSSVRP